MPNQKADSEYPKHLISRHGKVHIYRNQNRVNWKVYVVAWSVGKGKRQRLSFSKESEALICAIKIQSHFKVSKKKLKSKLSENNINKRKLRIDLKPQIINTTMPNNLLNSRRRTVFIVDKKDYNELEAYGNKMGFTASVLLREAVYRLADEIRREKRTILIRHPHPNEGHATK